MSYLSLSDLPGIRSRDAGANAARASDPKLLLSGLDSLYVSYDLDMHTGTLDWLTFAHERERLKHSRKEDLAELSLGSEKLALSPYGRYPYTYCLSNKAFEVRLGEHIKPGCYVQFFSAALWECGADNLLSRFDEWRRSLGLRLIREPNVSRVDWAFDYHLPTVDFTADHFVSRAAKDGAWREHQQAQTFYFGKGDTVIRIYNKVAEIEQQSGKVWFFDLWGQKEHVWRVEFQLRGDRLAEAGINTPADINDLQGDLLRELATKHTSLRVPSADSNRSRWDLHPLWQELTTDISRLPQTGLVRSIDPKMPLDYRLYQQSRGAYGLFKGIAALLALRDQNGASLSLDGFLKVLPSLLEQHHSESNWQQEIERRIAEYHLGKW